MPGAPRKAPRKQTASQDDKRPAVIKEFGAERWDSIPKAVPAFLAQPECPLTAGQHQLYWYLFEASVAWERVWAGYWDKKENRVKRLTQQAILQQLKYSPGHLSRDLAALESCNLIRFDGKWIVLCPDPRLPDQKLADSGNLFPVSPLFSIRESLKTVYLDARSKRYEVYIAPLDRAYRTADRQVKAVEKKNPEPPPETLEELRQRVAEIGNFLGASPLDEKGPKNAVAEIGKKKASKIAENGKPISIDKKPEKKRNLDSSSSWFSSVRAACRRWAENIDDDAVQGLIRNCQKARPDLTQEELIHFIDDRGQHATKNPVGLILRAVPEYVNGQALEDYRAKRARQLEQQTAAETSRTAEQERADAQARAILNDPNSSAEDKALARAALGLEEIA